MNFDSDFFTKNKLNERGDLEKAKPTKYISRKKGKGGKYEYKYKEDVGKKKGRVWTEEQKKKIAENDKAFLEHLNKKGIDRYSKEASNEFKTAGFQDKQKVILGKKKEITGKDLGSTPEERVANYKKLSPEDKKKFSDRATKELNEAEAKEILETTKAINKLKEKRNKMPKGSMKHAKIQQEIHIKESALERKRYYAGDPNSKVKSNLDKFEKEGKVFFSSFNDPSITTTEDVLNQRNVDFETGSQTGNNYYIRLSKKDIKKSIGESTMMFEEDFFKGKVLDEGGTVLEKAKQHKYVKRTGTPGKYRYWYKNPKTGKLTTDKKKVTAGKKEEKPVGEKNDWIEELKGLKKEPKYWEWALKDHKHDRALMSHDPKSQKQIDEAIKYIEDTLSKMKKGEKKEGGEKKNSSDKELVLGTIERIEKEGSRTGHDPKHLIYFGVRAGDIKKYIKGESLKGTDEYHQKVIRAYNKVLDQAKATRERVQGKTEKPNANVQSIMGNLKREYGYRDAEGQKKFIERVKKDSASKEATADEKEAGRRFLKEFDTGKKVSEKDIDAGLEGLGMTPKKKKVVVKKKNTNEEVNQLKQKLKDINAGLYKKDSGVEKQIPKIKKRIKQLEGKKIRSN